jgi:hypothetical protein
MIASTRANLQNSNKIILCAVPMHEMAEEFDLLTTALKAILLS